nr:capsid protein [Rat picobirnavirus]
MARGNNKSGRNNRNNSNNRNSRNNRNGHDKDKRVNLDNVREDKLEQIEDDKRKPGANTIDWYMKNPELLRSAASLPFASIVGNSLYGKSVPGVAVIPWMPVIGSTQAANQAFDSMYSFVVHANSRNKSYDSVDLGLLCLGVANVFSIIGSMLRAYGAVKFYTEENLYLPDTLISAMGFQPADMRSHLAQIWFDINNLINQTRQLWIPDVLPVVDRWYWMNTHIYTDAPGYRSQMYLYNQCMYYGYSETTSSTGGMLGLMKIDGSLAFSTTSGSTLFTPGWEVPGGSAPSTYTWAVWMTVAQSMIDLLIESQDRGIILGDILKAYGAEKIKTLVAIDSNFLVAPEYNAEVLMQFENFQSTSFTTNAIFQVNGQLRQSWEAQNTIASPTPSGTSANTIGTGILNFHFPGQPSPENITLATRAKIMGSKKFTGNGVDATGKVVSITDQLSPAAYSTEIYYDMLIYRRKWTNGGAASTEITQIKQMIGMSGSPSTVTETVSTNYMHLMAFDWHPFIYVANLPNGTITGMNSLYPECAYGDFDNYTTLDVTTLAKLHDVCTFSLFGVPHM